MKVRQGVFETNSSSSHSISIRTGNKGILSDSITPDEDGVIRVECGEYGWEVEKYDDARSKLSYILTSIFGDYNGYDRDDDDNIQKFIEETKETDLWKRVSRIVMQNTGYELDVKPFEYDTYYPFGYIDHQSSDLIDEVICDDNTLEQFIFNPYYILETDNDNH